MAGSCKYGDEPAGSELDMLNVFYHTQMTTARWFRNRQLYLISAANYVNILLDGPL
jgi:hypothetical protein